MTPTEQDKELREQVSTAMYDTDYKHVIEEPDYYDKAAVDAVVEFITADRKRVALEARIETVMYIDSMLRFENIPLHPVQSESLKQYLRQLEAQQEKL